MVSIFGLTVQRQTEGRPTEVRHSHTSCFLYYSTNTNLHSRATYSSLPQAFKLYYTVFITEEGRRPSVCPSVSVTVCVSPGADRQIQSVRQLMVNILQNHTKLDRPDHCPRLEPFRYRRLKLLIISYSLFVQLDWSIITTSISFCKYPSTWNPEACLMLKRRVSVHSVLRQKNVSFDSVLHPSRCFDLSHILIGWLDRAFYRCHGDETALYLLRGKKK